MYFHYLIVLFKPQDFYVDEVCFTYFFFPLLLLYISYVGIHCIFKVILTSLFFFFFMISLVLRGISEGCRFELCPSHKGMSCFMRASLEAQSSKDSTCNAGATGNEGLIPGAGRFPRGGNGKPLQDSCLKNTMDREAWWATVHGVAKSCTQLKRLSTHKRYI